MLRKCELVPLSHADFPPVLMDAFETPETETSRMTTKAWQSLGYCTYIYIYIYIYVYIYIYIYIHTNIGK